jgi:2-dehydro-3-deoxyglucarate aldolase/4-hydroxy-2-oxoheptanedioate aldolase
MSSLKAQCRSRELKLGHFVVEFATPGIGHILKNAGCDFVLLDMEHSGFAFETVKSTVRYCEAARLPAIVRVPSKAYDHLARAADVGAEAIMVPMVDTAAEARDLVSFIKYTPQGRRGMALGIAHDAYRPAGAAHDRLRESNERICLVGQIETASGLEQVDEIAAIEGVDCLWIGHNDLSASLGIPGAFGHERFLRAVDSVAAACRKHGKALGRLVPDAATGVALAAQGFDFICWSGDVWALQAAVRDGLDTIRAGAQKGAER